MGKLADRWGARRVFLLGLVLVLLGGVAGGLAPSFGALVGVRVILGVGASARIPRRCGFSATTRAASGARRREAVLGVLSLAALSSAAVGPTLGGFLTGAAGWRAVFVVNVPLAAIGIVLCLLFVEPDEPKDTRRDRGRRLTSSASCSSPARSSPTMLFAMSLKKEPRWWLVPAAARLFAVLLFHSRRRSRCASRSSTCECSPRTRRSARPTRASAVTCVLSYVDLLRVRRSGWRTRSATPRPRPASRPCRSRSPSVVPSLFAAPGRRRSARPSPSRRSALLAGYGGLLVLGDRASRLAIGVVGRRLRRRQGTSSVANQAAVYEQAPRERDRDRLGTPANRRIPRRGRCLESPRLLLRQAGDDRRPSLARTDDGGDQRAPLRRHPARFLSQRHEETPTLALEGTTMPLTTLDPQDRARRHRSTEGNPLVSNGAPFRARRSKRPAVSRARFARRGGPSSSSMSPAGPGERTPDR